MRRRETFFYSGVRFSDLDQDFGFLVLLHLEEWKGVRENAEVRIQDVLSSGPGHDFNDDQVEFPA